MVQRSKSPKRGSSSTIFMLLLTSILLVLGFYVSYFTMPNVGGDLSRQAMILYDSTVHSSDSLKQKVSRWTANGQIEDNKGGESEVNTEIVEESTSESLNYPDYSIEHWTPITVSLKGKNPNFDLCRLNFKDYSHAPHNSPMFKDLVKISNCKTVTKSLNQIKQEIKDNAGTPAGRVVYPSGFIFHESRVGSTLIANLLASDPMNMVFSESDPPSAALLRCNGCSKDDQVQLFRDVITVMGRSPVHERLFFKFQSITTTKIRIVLEAFPDVPWAFVFRQPVQTMMSHVAPGKGGGAPCLRSKGNPPEKVTKALEKVSNPKKDKIPDEGWCAAHLNMLCEHAAEAYDSYGHYADGVVRHRNEPGASESGKQRGILINYESLPGIIPSVVMPLFGVNPSDGWVNKMADESTQYSKGRGGSKSGVFTGDAEKKDAGASDSIRKWADLILQPSYEKLSWYAEESASSVGTVTLKRNEDKTITWSDLKNIDTKAISRKARSVSSPKKEISPNAKGGYKHPSLNPFNTYYNSSKFEIVNCPATPEPGYPKAYPIKDILDNWNTDETEIPPMHYDSICRFNYVTEYDKAMAYRNAEKPFVVYNIPEVEEVVRKWRDPDYLYNKLGKNKKYKCETSEDNHFMYWKNVGNRKHFTDVKTGTGVWSPPTGHADLTFEEWLRNAVENHNKTLESRHHLYFRATAMSEHGEGGWIFDELPFFKPKKSLFMVDPHEQKGIHCRFGMQSVIAESHFDGSRNMAASLGGLRRWILNAPDQCKNMHLLPKNHPSGRHSEVDWSKPDYERFPNFKNLQANELIVKAGDVLYLPTYWFHYIISLNVNYQCNTRSGISSENKEVIRKCGF